MQMAAAVRYFYEEKQQFHKVYATISLLICAMQIFAKIMTLFLWAVPSEVTDCRSFWHLQLTNNKIHKKSVTCHDSCVSHDTS